MNGIGVSVGVAGAWVGGAAVAGRGLAVAVGGVVVFVAVAVGAATTGVVVMLGALTRTLQLEMVFSEPFVKVMVTRYSSVRLKVFGMLAASREIWRPCAGFAVRASALAV